MIRNVIAGLMLCVLVVSEVWAQDSVGWRGDGLGCYADAKPALEWAADKNVVWAVETPSWSNATPVLVDGKIILTSEQTDLLCVQKSDGKLLWKQSNTYFDTMTEEEIAAAKEMQKKAQAVREEIHPLERQQHEFKKQLDEIGNFRRRIKELEQKQALREMPEQLAKQVADVEKKKADTDAQLEKNPNNGGLKRRAEQFAEELRLLTDDAFLKAELEKTQKRLAVVEPKEAELKKQEEALRRQINEIRKNRLEPLTKYDLPATDSTNGYASCTPVSDGSRVFAVFTNGMVGCYDMDGNRRWTKFVEKPTHGWGFSTSPVLAAGKVIVHLSGLVALDCETGDDVWKVREADVAWGTPIVTTVGGVEIVVTPKGDFVRASDGKLLARRQSKLEFATPIVNDNVVYFMEKGGKAIKLPEEIGADDAFKTEVLWTLSEIEGDRYYASAVYHDGIIYCINQKSDFSAVDAATGKLIYAEKLNLGATVYPSVTLAGDKLFVSAENGVTAVVQPGREFKEIGRNKLEHFRSSPVFDGKRMYIRTMKKLYCIGE